MLNWWEELALSVILGVLHQVIKNPKSKSIELSVVNTILAAAQEAQAALSANQ